MARRENWEIYNANPPSPAFPFQLVFSQLLTSASYLLIGYFLLRWLYYPPTGKQDQDQALEPAEDASDQETGGAAEE
jgi:hypothetical protein